MCAARHTDQTEKVHWEKSDVEAYGRYDRNPYIQASGPHFTDYLGQPEIDGADRSEQDATDGYVVEVCNHKIAVLLLRIRRRRGVHNSGKTAHHEHPNEPDAENHRRSKTHASAPDRADPVEYLNPGRNGYCHGQQ